MNTTLLADAYRDYEAAVKAARALWPSAAENTLREAAADFLVHVRELRRQTPPAAGAVSPAPTQERPARTGPYAPTEKQVAFFQRLIKSSVFSEEERRRSLEWLATKATKQTIKDQIDYLKVQVETRKTTNGNGGPYGQ